MDSKHCKEKVDYVKFLELTKRFNLMGETASTFKLIIDNDAPKKAYGRLTPNEATELLEAALPAQMRHAGEGNKKG